MKTNIFYHFKKATSIDEQTKERKYKYYQDYIDTLSEEDILEFLKDDYCNFAWSLCISRIYYRSVH